jgi:uncharacterized alpha-E superfamily protein
LQTIAIVRAAAVGPGNEIDRLALALELADSNLTYRWRYPTGLRLLPVFDVLYCDETNPRSVAYQFEKLAALFVEGGTLGGLPSGLPSAYPWARSARGGIENGLARLARLARLRLVGLERGGPAAMTAELARCEEELLDLSRRLTEACFAANGDDR